MPQIIRKKYNAVICAVILLAALWTPVHIHAQSAGKMERRADKSFKNKDYYNAAKLYAALLYDSAALNTTTTLLYPFQPGSHNRSGKVRPSHRVTVLYQLAESYRLCYHYREALPQYGQYLSSQDTRFPLARLWYGICLNANDEPGKAIKAFDVFLKEHKTEDAYTQSAKLGIATSHFIITNKIVVPKDTIIKLATVASADGSNFALDKINDSSFWFSTSRNELNKRKEKEYPVRLYSGKFNDNTVEKITAFPVKDMNAGASSLSADGLTLYFTGWKDNTGNTKLPGTNYAVFYMKRAAVDSPWSAPVVMPDPVNVTGFNSRQPVITRDNKYLFFSSDRPGGMGKYDIWMVHIDGRQPVSAALNPGNAVNTAAEEASPFYDADAGYLYFSSDGREGMGGMDIYKVSGSPAGNQWSANVINLGYPLNSVKNDLYYRRDAYSDTTAYFSSDRASACCLEIFKAVRLPVRDTIMTKDTSGRSFTIIQNKLPEDIINASMDSVNAITIQRRYVNYNFASTRIRRTDYAQLDNMVRVMKNDPVLNILVASFTDCIGSGPANILLSRKRSESVKAYLLKKGINPSRINIDFFGNRHFILPCREDSSYNQEKQMANRRSDLLLTTEKNARWHPSGLELDIKELMATAHQQKEQTGKLTAALPDSSKRIMTHRSADVLIDKMAISELLDRTPKLKAPDVVEEMTKRIPRKPLLLYSTSDSVHIELYDNGIFDYDTVSVIYNKKIVAYKQLLQTNKPISFYVKLNSDQSKNEMIFFAENLGLTPPNSALMIITDGDNKRTEVNVSSDMEHNTVVYFIKVKK